MHKSHGKDTKKKNSAQNTHVFKDNSYYAQDGICMVPHGGYTAKAVNTAKAVQTAQVGEKSQYAAIEVPISGISTVTCYLPNSFVSAQMNEQLTLDDIVLMSATSACSADAYDFGMSGASLYVHHSSAYMSSVNISSAYISSAISAVYTSNLPISHGGLFYQFASSCRHAGGKYIAAGLLAMNLVQGMVLPYVANAASYDNEILSGSTMTLNNGDTATDTTINSGGSQVILSDGSATDTTINSGGFQAVSNGGTATDTTINSGGKQEVFNGGTATSTFISSVGRQFVKDGGTATDTTINIGGGQEVLNSGTATDTTINSGGYQDVSSGGTATDTTINSDGYQDVSNGGTATSTTINSGRQYIEDGGIATSTTINSGGYQYVSSGGSATDTTISAGGSQTIYSGGTATDTIINNSGWQSILSGGTATDTTINDGWQQVFSGGSATSTFVNSGGRLDVQGGASITSTTVSSGGYQAFYGAIVEANIKDNILSSGASQGFAYGAVASSGGIGGVVSNGITQIIENGGSAHQVSVNSGGKQTVFSGGSITSTTVSSGGYQVFQGAIVEANIKDNILSSGASQGFAYGAVASGGIGGVVSSGITQIIENGGSAHQVNVNSDGGQVISSGGSATSTTVNSGGSQVVSSGGSATSTTVSSGGSQVVNSGGFVSATTVSSGGFMSAHTSATVVQTILHGGTLQGDATYGAGETLIGQGGSATQNVSFAGGTFSPVLYISGTDANKVTVDNNVTGTATGTIAPLWQNDVALEAGKVATFDVLETTTGTIEGTFGTAKELVKATYEQQLTNGDKLLQLIVTGKAADFVENYGHAFNQNSINLGNLLDYFDDNGVNLEFLTALGNLPADADIVNAALEQLLPLNAVTMQHVNTAFFRNIMSQIPSFNNGFSQMLSAPTDESLPAGSEMSLNAGASNTQKGWSVFGSPFGMTASQGDYEGISGYDISLAGVNVGAMRFFDDAWFGFSTAYAHHELDMKSQNSSVSGDQLAFMLFGGIKFDNNFLLEGALGYSYTWNNSEREIGYGTYTDHVTADFNQNNFMASLKFGYLWELDNGLRIIPSIGLDYVYSYTSAFEESGGSAALGFKSNSVHSLQIPVHLRLEKTFNINDMLITPQLTLGYIPELADTYAISTAYFTNAATTATFKTQSVENSRHTFMAGAGLEVKLNDAVSLAVDYELNVRDDFNSHSVNLMFEWKF